MDYTVVMKSDPIEFQARIIELLAVGWELQGGVSIAFLERDDYKHLYYAQALIKKPKGLTR
jgi:hypothetical protein